MRPRIFVVLCYHFHLFPGIKKISSLTHSLFSDELFNLRELLCLLEICLLFILFYCIVIRQHTKSKFNLFEIVKICFVSHDVVYLEKLPCAAEKKVHSLVCGWNFL